MGAPHYQDTRRKSNRHYLGFEGSRGASRPNCQQQCSSVATRARCLKGQWSHGSVESHLIQSYCAESGKQGTSSESVPDSSTSCPTSCNRRLAPTFRKICRSTIYLNLGALCCRTPMEAQPVTLPRLVWTNGRRVRRVNREREVPTTVSGTSRPSGFHQARQLRGPALGHSGLVSDFWPSPDQSAQSYGLGSAPRQFSRFAATWAMVLQAWGHFRPELYIGCVFDKFFAGIA